MVRLTSKNDDDKGGNDSSNCLYTTLKHGVTLESPSQIRPTNHVEKVVFKTIMGTANRCLRFGVSFHIIANSFHQHHLLHEGRKANEFYSIVMKQRFLENGDIACNSMATKWIRFS